MTDLFMFEMMCREQYDPFYRDLLDLDFVEVASLLRKKDLTSEEREFVIIRLKEFGARIKDSTDDVIEERVI